MATAVSVCSNALQMLGDKPINSFTEGTQAGGIDRARICANFWPTVRDSVLRSHPWKSAKARVILSPEATIPAFGYSHRFALPSNWLRNIEINGIIAEEVDYETETASSTSGSKRLLIDSSEVKLIYVWRNEDVESWDPLLVDAAEYAMAARMAYPITQSEAMIQLMEQKLAMKLKEARAVDSQDESPQQLGSFEVLGARRSLTPIY